MDDNDTLTPTPTMCGYSTTREVGGEPEVVYCGLGWNHDGDHGQWWS